MHESPELTPTQKGNIAEANIAARAIELGIGVLKPLNEGLRYDLLFDFHPELARVQCKWARREGDVLVIRTSTSRFTPNGYVRTIYGADEVDLFAAYSPDLGRCYVLPLQEFAGQSSVQLRLTPARNNQVAAIRWAHQYELGAVAQLGERSAGSRKVVGSNPISSTSAPASVGAHAFRDRFGFWLERAARGEEVIVTRHGKPYVRLASAGQLQLARFAA
jgi:prevent-host-death family protein